MIECDWSLYLQTGLLDLLCDWWETLLPLILGCPVGGVRRTLCVLLSVTVGLRWGLRTRESLSDAVRVRGGCLGSVEEDGCGVTACRVVDATVLRAKPGVCRCCEAWVEVWGAEAPRALNVARHIFSSGGGRVTGFFLAPRTGDFRWPEETDRLMGTTFLKLCDSEEVRVRTGRWWGDFEREEDVLGDADDGLADTDGLCFGSEVFGMGFLLLVCIGLVCPSLDWSDRLFVCWGVSFTSLSSPLFELSDWSWRSHSPEFPCEGSKVISSLVYRCVCVWMLCFCVSCKVWVFGFSGHVCVVLLSWSDLVFLEPSWAWFPWTWVVFVSLCVFMIESECIGGSACVSAPEGSEVTWRRSVKSLLTLCCRERRTLPNLSGGLRGLRGCVLRRFRSPSLLKASSTSVSLLDLNPKTPPTPSGPAHEWRLSSNSVRRLLRDSSRAPRSAFSWKEILLWYWNLLLNERRWMCVCLCVCLFYLNGLFKLRAEILENVETLVQCECFFVFTEEIDQSVAFIHHHITRDP